MSRLFKVRFFEDEHLNSFASRTARANGRSSLRGFLKDFGIDGQWFLRGEETQVLEFSKHLEMPAADLLHRRFKVTESGDVEIKNNWFAKNMVARYRFRFCAHCLLDDERDQGRKPGTRQYGRIGWAIASVRTCPVHDRKLSEMDQYHYVAQDFSVLVDTHRAFICDEANRDLTSRCSDFEKFVVDRLGGLKADGGYLDGRPLSVAIDLSHFVGMASRHGPEFRSRKMDGEEARLCAEAGFQILRGGRQEFDRFLDKLASVGGKSNNRGGRSLYGWLYSLLEVRDESYEFVREAIRSHATARELVSGVSVFGKVDKRPWTTIRAIAIESGRVESVVLNHLKRIGFLKNSPFPKGEVFIPSDVAADAVSALRDTIKMQDVTELLRCSNSLCYHLEAAGFLHPHFADAPENIVPRRRYLRSHVEEFRRRIETISFGEKCELTSIRAASRPSRMPYHRMIEMVLRGELNSAKYIDKGLLIDSIFVDVDELKSKAVPDGMIGSKEICARLVISSYTLGGLVAAKVLNAVHRERYQADIVVPEADVVEFENRHVSAGRIAAENGLNVHSVVAAAKRADVRPSVDAAIAHVSVFHQADVEKILASVRTE